MDLESADEVKLFRGACGSKSLRDRCKAVYTSSSSFAELVDLNLCIRDRGNRYMYSQALSRSLWI